MAYGQTMKLLRPHFQPYPRDHWTRAGSALFRLSVDIAILFFMIPDMLNFSPSTQR